MIDYLKIDKLLKELYEGDGKYPVSIGETFLYLFPEYGDDEEREYSKYMSELEGLGLARETGNATIMKITQFGKEVYRFGGWVKYQKSKIEEKQKQEEKENYKHQLEIEQHERDIEKLKYEESVRELDQEIKNLTTKNLKLQNIQIIYGLLGTLFGFVAAFLSEHWFGLIRILIKYLIK